MTPKITPAFDGTTSWFEFEDLIDDWLGITTLTAEKHGPLLKNAFTDLGKEGLQDRLEMVSREPTWTKKVLRTD